MQANIIQETKTVNYVDTGEQDSNISNEDQSQENDPAIAKSKIMKRLYRKEISQSHGAVGEEEEEAKKQANMSAIGEDFSDIRQREQNTPMNEIIPDLQEEEKHQIAPLESLPAGPRTEEKKDEKPLEVAEEPFGNFEEEKGEGDDGFGDMMGDGEFGNFEGSPEE